MTDPGSKRTCASCLEAVVSPYYTINGTIVCAACRRPIERQLRGQLGVGQLGRATLFGLGGSLLGIGIYLGLPILYGIEVGLLAVAVGYPIGKAVRWGSGGFGGLSCRLIAVGLTYVSLGIAYLGVAFLTIGGDGPNELPATLKPTDVPAMLGQAVAMPLLRVRWSPSHVLIIGFALWQAWRLNRPLRSIVDGPLALDFVRTS